MSQRNGEGNQSPGVFLNQRRTPGFSFALVSPRLCRNISDEEFLFGDRQKKKQYRTTQNRKGHVYEESGNQ